MSDHPRAVARAAQANPPLRVPVRRVTHRTLFPSVVSLVELDDDELVADLVAVVSRVRSEEQMDLPVAARGAWSSRFDLLDRNDESLSRLTELVRFHTQELRAATHEASYAGVGVDEAPPQRDVAVESITGWAVSLEPGGFQHRHVHGSADFVAVFYAAVPPQSGGSLVFDDPRPGRIATTKAFESVFQTVEFAPRPGLLVVFPGWMSHGVDVVAGGGDRISINFDIRLRLADGRGGSDPAGGDAA